MRSFNFSATIKPITKAQVLQIGYWRYEAPYDLYDMGPFDVEDLTYFLDLENAFHALTDMAGEMLAFCSFGPDGQVPGGDYSAEALDIGMGVRPDLTGQGHGLWFARTVHDFADWTFEPLMFRVTIAEFNERAMRIWQKVGFEPTHNFKSTYDNLDFVVLVK